MPHLACRGTLRFPQCAVLKPIDFKSLRKHLAARLTDFPVED
jgi:hypothetical protein